MKINTLLAAICAAAIFACPTEAAPAFETVGELCTELLNTANGSLSTSYEKPGIITSPTQWQVAVNEATRDLTGEITLTISGFNEEDYDLDKIADYNMSISASGRVQGNMAKITYSFTYSPNYRIIRAYEDSSLLPVLNNDELAALTKAYSIVRDIVTDDMTDYEKELAIHDYIVANYQYDVAAATNAEDNVVRTHSITGMLLEGKGVCEAYSNTFMLMCRMAGLNCELATGVLDGVKHQWNIIELGGEYYNVDLTSDDPVPDVSGRVRYTCFNLSDEELSKTHTIDEENIDCTGVRYNYYTYNNLVVTSRDELLILLNDKLDRGIREITFKTSGGYILYDASDVSAAAEGRGLNSVTVVGEYGKEGVFYVTYS